MRRPLLLAVACAALLAGAAPAHAVLVYEKGVLKPYVYVARDDGSRAHRLARGSFPRVSADGLTVAFETPYTQRRLPQLRVIPAAGGAQRTLLKGWWDPYSFDWSPDSKTIVAVTGKEIGIKKLVLIDVATGAKRTLATGGFFGAGFSPAGDSVAWARARSDDYPPRSDVYSVPVAGGTPVRLTTGGRSVSPLWGPSSIAFGRQKRSSHSGDYPKQNIWLMDPGGTNQRALTGVSVPYLLQGLTPTAWSDDGSRLLAEFGGQDTSFLETVDPATGNVRQVNRSERRALVGFDLSHDGSTILAATGGPDPGTPHIVVSLPYRGGAMKTLAKGGFNADWNR